MKDTISKNDEISYVIRHADERNLGKCTSRNLDYPKELSRVINSINQDIIDLGDRLKSIDFFVSYAKRTKETAFHIESNLVMNPAKITTKYYPEIMEKTSYAKAYKKLSGKKTLPTNAVISSIILKDIKFPSNLKIMVTHQDEIRGCFEKVFFYGEYLRLINGVIGDNERRLKFS